MTINPDDVAEIYSFTPSQQSITDGHGNPIAPQDSVLRGDPLTFGKAIKSWRQCEEWTQAVVAKRVGISKQQLSDYENGRKLPSIEQAIRLCTALEMPVSVALRCLLDEQIQQAGITGYRISLEKVG